MYCEKPPRVSTNSILLSVYIWLCALAHLLLVLRNLHCRDLVHQFLTNLKLNWLRQLLSLLATKGFKFGSGFACISSLLEVYQHAYH